MFLVDTNVLVYAANADSPHHAPSRRLLDAWRRRAAAWYVTWGICYEFLRVITHRRVLRSPWSAPAAWGFIEALLASPGLAVLLPTDRHQAVARETLALVPHVDGNLWHDLATAVLMREHGLARIYTRDTDFHRFPFLEPVDPLTAES